MSDHSLPLQIANAAASPLAPSSALLEPRQKCRITRQVAWEMYCLFSGNTSTGRNQRHAAKHVRDIAVYVSHVALPMAADEVARCFGRDGASVRTLCLQVEERREEAGYDEFVSAVERLAKSIMQILEGQSHDGIH